MKDIEINVLIAEACGWYLARKTFPNDKGSKSKYSNGYRYQHKDGRWASAGTSMHGWGWCSSPDAAAYKLPDYCHDLNAMFVAEKMFPNDTKESEYALELLKLVSRWAKPGFDWGDQCQNDFYRVANATARQRALAFMAVCGLEKKTGKDEDQKH